MLWYFRKQSLINNVLWFDNKFLKNLRLDMVRLRCCFWYFTVCILIQQLDLFLFDILMIILYDKVCELCAFNWCSPLIPTFIAVKWLLPGHIPQDLGSARLAKTPFDISMMCSSVWVIPTTNLPIELTVIIPEVFIGPSYRNLQVHCSVVSYHGVCSSKKTYTYWRFDLTLCYQKFWMSY